MANRVISRLSRQALRRSKNRPAGQIAGAKGSVDKIGPGTAQPTAERAENNESENNTLHGFLSILAIPLKRGTCQYPRKSLHADRGTHSDIANSCCSLTRSPRTWRQRVQEIVQGQH